MAQQLPCDICNDEPALQMVTNLTDGSVLTMGANCLPGFYGQSALMVMDAGEHKGPAGKCQACRRMHERMTTPVAQLDTEPAADTAEAAAQPAGSHAVEG
jgi:hypothetical protein